MFYRGWPSWARGPARVGFISLLAAIGLFGLVAVMVIFLPRFTVHNEGVVLALSIAGAAAWCVTMLCAVVIAFRLQSRGEWP